MNLIERESFNSKRELLPPLPRSICYRIGELLGHSIYKAGHYLGRKLWAISVLANRYPEDNLWTKLKIK